MCGVVGIYQAPEAQKLAYLGLYALQHRGQESAGIVSGKEKAPLKHHRAMGLVADIFTERVLERIEGTSAIGHTRYSTAGETRLINSQPFLVNYAHGDLAIAHNGNLVNAVALRNELEARGSIFQSTMDTEVIVHLIASSNQASLIDRVSYALNKVEGAYSVVFLTESRMIAARDPQGFRPLILGDYNGSPVVVSETCALDLMDATFVREIDPGEVLLFDENGITSTFPLNKRKKALCIFEHVYFSRPDSMIFGRNVYETRKGFGKQLAKEQPVEADMVLPVPDSGVPAALGYAEESGIPFEMGLIRNHYVGRTFIEPTDQIRNFGVKIKLNPVEDTVKGKRIVLVDDSIVRGTTCRKIVKMLFEAGAAEVHFRISSPPTSWPCFYGIDTPDRNELISAQKSVEEIRAHVGCTSLAYLSREGLFYFQKDPGEWFCDACFSGNFPVDLTDAKAQGLFKES